MKSQPNAAPNTAIAANESLFEDELVTLKEILAVLKIGATKWWEGVRAGIYPQPIRLGRRCTRWSRNAIRDLMARGVL